MNPSLSPQMLPSPFLPYLDSVIIVSLGKIKPQSPKVPTVCPADVIASGVDLLSLSNYFCAPETGGAAPPEGR